MCFISTLGFTEGNRLFEAATGSFFTSYGYCHSRGFGLFGLHLVSSGYVVRRSAMSTAPAVSPSATEGKQCCYTPARTDISQWYSLVEPF